MSLRDNHSSETVKPRPSATWKAEGERDASDQRSTRRKPRELQEYKTENYEPLPKKRGAIRLLNLLPSNTDSSEIHCELLTPKEGQNEHRAYEAISWCWGTGDKKAYINIRSKGRNYAKYVALNLFMALKALRLPNKDRYLWIDAVCINQEYLPEKNHQVEMMYEIYGNAERVCIWLGEENASSRMALRFIKEEVLQLQDFDTLCDSEHASKKWRALLELMQRPWFSRRWVVQEIALARMAVIYCGKDRISWNKFAIAVELFVEVETATHRLSEVMKKDRQYEYIPGWFEYVSALGASLLVDATERLFRDYKNVRRPLLLNDEQAHASDIDSDADSIIDGDTTMPFSQNPQSEASGPPSAWKDMSSIEKSRVQPLLSLEYLVSSLTIFETSVAHDTIYALLAIAKDTTPRAARSNAMESSDHARAGLEMFTQRKRYNVDYEMPYVDVCREFIQFSIERSLHGDRSRALDVICRPWATPEKTLKRLREQKKRKEEVKEEVESLQKRRGQMRHPIAVSNRRAKTTYDITPTSNRIKLSSKMKEPSLDGNTHDRRTDTCDMSLPSWIPQLSEAPYAMYPQPGMAGPKMSRKNADPLVGLPSVTNRNYSAAETKEVDMKSLKFRKRPEFDHYSMYVRGFCLDEIQDVEQVARIGQIPSEWAELAKWVDAKGPPPDAFWRTLVGDRGRDGKNPPVYYSRACKESFKKGGFESGAIDTTALINYERNSVVAQFCRRAQAVIWNRALIMTKAGRLGLVGKNVEKGDKVCILYGCSVPVILRKSKQKTPKEFNEEMHWEIAFVQRTVAKYYRQYVARKMEHLKRKNADMVKICRQWEKERSWLRLNGSTGIDELERTREAFTSRLARMVNSALEDFDIWYEERRSIKAKTEWEALEAKKINELEAREKAQDRARIRQNEWIEANLRTCKTEGTVWWVDANVDGPQTNASLENRYENDETTINGKPKNAETDWREFEAQVTLGRRWKKIVRDKKANMQAEWRRNQAEEHKKRQQRYRDKSENAAHKQSRAQKDDTQDTVLNRVHGREREPSSESEIDLHTLKRRRLNNGVQENDPGFSGLRAPPLAVDDERHKRKNSSRAGIVIKLNGMISPDNVRIRKFPLKKTPIRSKLSEDEAIKYRWEIMENFRQRLGEDGWYSYQMLGECYIHGMMDGEAMLYQNEGKREAIPSQVFEIR